jgi:hypothetical protein
MIVPKIDMDAEAFDTLDLVHLSKSTSALTEHVSTTKVSVQADDMD